MPEDQQYELVAVDQLIPHPDNPRRARVEPLADSIAANGFYGAVIAQRSTRRILAGNHRWQAACEQGLAAVPVLWVDVDDDRARRIMLVDNRSSDLATWDNESLASLLSDMGADLSGTLFEPVDLDELTLMVAAPTLDELDERVGAWDDATDGLVSIRLRVPPEVAERFRAALAAQPGDTPGEQLAALLA